MGYRWASRLGKIMGSKDYIIEEIPPKVYAAVRYYAEGESWEGACKIVGITPKTVRK